MEPLSTLRWRRGVGQTKSLVVGAWEIVSLFNQCSKTSFGPWLTLSNLLPRLEVFFRHKERGRLSLNMAKGIQQNNCHHNIATNGTHPEILYGWGQRL
jgi:hypothetical protein